MTLVSSAISAIPDLTNATFSMEAIFILFPEETAKTALSSI
jgi:hypothetical protein